MKALLRLTLIVLVFGVSLFLCSHYILECNSTQVLSQGILKNYLIFTLWRFSLYAVMMSLWSYLIREIGNKKKWSIQVINYFSQQKIKLLIFFSFIEIFFVWNALGYLINLI